MSNHYASVSVENTPEIESGPLRAETPLSFKSASEHKVVKLAKKSRRSPLAEADAAFSSKSYSNRSRLLTYGTRSTSNIHKKWGMLPGLR